MYPITVLIAEDDLIVSESLAMSLSLKFKVHKAFNGKDAWEVLQKEEIDCLITDIDMPVMDGLELLEKLKESGHSTKAIVVSGRNCPDTKKRCTELGAGHYLSKPYDTEELIECIHMMTS